MSRERSVRYEADESWRADAVCASLAPDLQAAFFDDSRDVEARAHCADCPVARACLTYGMGEMAGIWGGFNQRERRALKRHMRLGRTLDAAITAVEFTRWRSGYGGTHRRGVLSA